MRHLEEKELCIAAYIHHIEGLDPKTSQVLFDRLFQHATQSHYMLRIQVGVARGHNSVGKHECDTARGRG